MIQPPKHTVIMISIVEYDPAARESTRENNQRGLNQDTKFTVRHDTTNGAIDKAIKRLQGFKDDDE